MGMYTALHFAATLRADTPASVLDTLHYMMEPRRFPEAPYPDHPDHPLFHTDRWDIMLACDSYYFNADTHSVLRRGWDGHSSLSVTSNFKNYDGELDLFLDWITPYVAAYDGDWLGYHMYEEDEQPTLIFHPANKDLP